jgi:uncharacterized membrane protein YfcA
MPGRGARSSDNMYLHLSIAQLTVLWPLVVGAGFAVGLLSGLFGVGGGFLISPILMFIGIPTEVAISSGANQSVAASASAAMAQWRLGNVDLRMSMLLLAGGTVGSLSGVQVVAALRTIGQIELVISLAYAFLLGSLGSLMAIEGINALRAARKEAGGERRRRRQHYAWVHGLPWKMRFPRSKLYMSVVPPIVLGFIVGNLGAIMGVGGGFLLVPAMVYILKMPTQVVVGTSLIQVSIVSAFTTFLHAYNLQTVDIELAMLLIVGGVIGAQWGSRMSTKIKAEQLRALLGLLVLLVGFRFVLLLLMEPADAYSLSAPRG